MDSDFGEAVFWVRECRICGIWFGYKKFLKLFKKRRGEVQEKIAYWVLRRYGVVSEQFVFVIQALVLWCVLRYNFLGFDEDLYFDCLVTVLEKVKNEYDRELGDLLDFVHTVVRGEITKWIFKKTKREKVERKVEEEVVEEDFLYLYDVVDIDSVDVIGDDGVEVELERRIMEDVYREKMVEGVDESGREVYYRRMLWELMKRSVMLL